VNNADIPKRRILVVDDEPMVCDAVELMLSFDGHSVKTAANGAEALAYLDAAPFDLVITDYAMPQMKGDELAIRIKARRPATPVVMITAHAELLAATRTPLPGIAMVISKPFMLETLRDAILRTCNAPSPSAGA
jgi:DNA-binding NtrC family response regulator